MYILYISGGGRCVVFSKVRVAKALHLCLVCKELALTAIYIYLSLVFINKEDIKD